MIQERNKNSFLRRLYPTTKLWMCLGLTLSIILFANTWYSVAIFLLGLYFIFTEKFYLEFKIIAVTLTLMFISMFLINGTLNPINDYTKDPVFVLPVLNIKFYAEGLARSVSVYRRIAPLMCTLFVLFRSINMTDLGVSLNEAGIPYRASFVFINVFQIIPVLSKEMSQITDAQKSRGLQMEGNVLQRVKALAPIIIPVISNSIMKVQNQAIALSTKGFNSDRKKTVYRELPKAGADYVLKAASILLAVGSIAFRVAVSVVPAWKGSI